jgi:PAS domain S-box-containing protein
LNSTGESTILTNSMKLSVFGKWSDDVSFRVKGLFLLVFPLGALVLMVWLISTMASGRRAAEEWVRDSIEVRLCTQRAEILLLEMESQFAAYLTTGNADLLGGHARSEASLLAILSQLEARLASNPDSRKPLGEIRDAINGEHGTLSLLREGVANQKTLGLQARMQFEQVVRSTRDAGAKLEAMESEENRLLGLRLSQQQLVYSKLFVTAIAIACLCPILGFILNLLLSGRVTKRLGRLRSFVHLLVHELPMMPVPGGKDEIGQLGKELGVTARALNERERNLRRREQQLIDVFEQAPVALHELDAQGVIRRANQAECELLGYERAEILGMHVWDLVSPEQRSAYLQTVMGVVERESAGGSVVQDYLRKDGSRIRLSVRLKAISADRGRVKGVCSVLLSVPGPPDTGYTPADWVESKSQGVMPLALEPDANRPGGVLPLFNPNQCPTPAEHSPVSFGG